jgi:hypothetical protein
VIPLSEEQAVSILALAERGGGVYRYLEQSLEARGWRFIGYTWRSPAEIAQMPICRYCHEPFHPDADRHCYSDASESSGWMHAVATKMPEHDGPLFDPRPIEDKL